MHHLRRSVISANKHRWFSILKPQNGFRSVAEANRHKCVSDVGLAAPFSSKAKYQILSHPTLFDFVKKGIAGGNGNSVPLKGHWMKEYNAYSSLHKSTARSFSSTATEQQRNKSSKPRKEISTTEDPFDPLTDKIPEKPVTFVEGASYSLVILAGLGIAAAAAYAVFSELIFEPKEYKVFGKALERVQNDGQVRVRIGSPITGYGQESRNRAARQRIPNRIRTDEDGVEHIQVNFFIRGPQGSGKVWAEMFKDKKDKEWKYTSLIVEITSPSRTQLILESYLPSSDTAAFTPSR